MDNLQLEKYEYKSPSYFLLDRPVSVNPHEHVKKRRFLYDPDSGTFRSKESDKDSISMLFCGDLLCQEHMLERYSTNSGSYDFSPCFTYVKPLLQSADFSSGNLETSISHTAPYRGEILTHEGPYYCNAPLEYLAALSDAGFDMLTTENNHTLDAGVRGLVETIENIKKLGLLQTGTFIKEQDKFLIADICGFKVGFTAFGTGDYNTMQTNLTQEGRDMLLNTYSPARAKAICHAMREKGAEYLICFPHWGTEYTDVLTLKQTTIASELTAVGFDLVLGSHAHVIQKLNIIHKTPVVYSMGNLISHLNTSGKQDVPLSVLCRVTLNRSDSHIQSSLEFIPCKILKKFNGIPYTVVPLSEALGTTELLGADAERIRDAVISRLECDPSQVITDFSLRPDYIADYRTECSTISTKLDNLHTVRRNKIKPAPISIPKKHFWDTCTGYLEERNALYKLFPNHAELILVTRTTSVLTLPTDVAQRPVEIISSGCANNTTRIVYLGKNVKILKSAAFQNYTKLESIRMYNHLTVIGKAAFSGCTNMTGITLPDSLVTIKANAFADCTRLLSVKIPPSVVKISPIAFRNCPALTIYCAKGSYADQYAHKHQIPVKYMPMNYNVVPPSSKK